MEAALVPQLELGQWLVPGINPSNTQKGFPQLTRLDSLRRRYVYVCVYGIRNDALFPDRCHVQYMPCGNPYLALIPVIL